MPQMASMEKNDPIDNVVEHLKYKIQRSRQWTKHTYIDSIWKDDLFYNLILLYLYLFFFVLFCFVSLKVFVVPPLPTGLSTSAAMCNIFWLFFRRCLVSRMEDSFKCTIFEIYILINKYTLEGAKITWTRLPSSMLNVFFILAKCVDVQYLVECGRNWTSINPKEG